MERKTAPTLYVDLDGTFIKSDMLLESFVCACKLNPLVIFSCLIWLFSGRAKLKQKLSEYAINKMDIASIPVNPEFFAYLSEEKRLGRKIILATASNEHIADAFVQTYPELFDDFIASSDKHNLKGKNKLAKIKELEQNFAYAGNASEDFVLFAQAEQSLLVNPSSPVKKRVKSNDFTHQFDCQTPPKLKTWLTQLRVHQWLKNSLILVPLFVSGQYFETVSLVKCVFAFIAFSFLASATYIINDLLDLNSDRRHSRKKNRPLAASNISIVNALLISKLLALSAFAIAFKLGFEFLLILCGYLVLTLAYSFKVKTYFAMDVIALACLYTIRIFAGAAVISVTVSFWLLSFSMFIFLSLALVKRVSELKSLTNKSQQQVVGRDYNTSDMAVLMSFGSASSLLAILMFCFYINSQALTNQYQQLTLLWLVIPVMGYWLMRMWVKTTRGEMHDDPIVFSLKDKGSIVSLLIMFTIVGLAQLL